MLSCPVLIQRPMLGLDLLGFGLQLPGFLVVVAVHHRLLAGLGRSDRLQLVMEEVFVLPSSL